MNKTGFSLIFGFQVLALSFGANATPFHSGSSGDSGTSAKTPSLIVQNASARRRTTNHFSTSTMQADGFAKQELSYKYGVLKATGAGTATFTYLGSDAEYTDSFGTSKGLYFVNHGTTASMFGSTFTEVVSKAGILDFGFATASPAYTVTNKQNLQGKDNFYGKNEGAFGIVVGGTVANKHYDYLLIYNDPVKNGDHDFNDLVVGVNFSTSQVTPVPEPQTYAMMMAGLCLVGFVSRRKDKAPAAA